MGFGAVWSLKKNDWGVQYNKEQDFQKVFVFIGYGQ